MGAILLVCVYFVSKMCALLNASITARETIQDTIIVIMEFHSDMLSYSLLVVSSHTQLNRIDGNCFNHVVGLYWPCTFVYCPEASQYCKNMEIFALEIVFVVTQRISKLISQNTFYGEYLNE